ncbi:MAG: DNA translocase FtsK, partial [Clostridia bacterium]|nr:DNA translocase FtsK [Clostridia bacterium]
IEHSAEAVYDEGIIKDIEKEAELCGNKGKKSGASVDSDPIGAEGDADPMLKAAIDLAVEMGKISTSLIQRRLSLGYGRAAKLIDRMEQLGYVSAPDGQKPREVLVSKEQFMEMVVRGDDLQ